MKVFVSYKWSTENETKIVEALEKHCQQRGIELIRDNKTLEHGASITQFMNKLSKGDHVITVFSKSYFQSSWCMYELLRIYQRGDFAERTHPIIADDCDLQISDYRLNLVKYWENKFVEEQAKLRDIDQLDVIKEVELVKIYRDIQQNINEIINFAADRVTTPLKALQNQNYTQLLDRIKPLPSQTALPEPEIKHEALTPDILAAWINRKKQWDKHIIDRIETKAKEEKALAFIISGVEEEWPDALRLRTHWKFRVPSKKDTVIRPKFTGKFNPRKECGLWYSILEKLIMDKTELEALEMHEYETTLISELSKSQESKFFFWEIDKSSPEHLNCTFLKGLAERWQDLVLKDSPHSHYLIIIYGFEKKGWYLGQRKVNNWHRNMEKNLAESHNPLILVPELKSPTKEDLGEWINQYHSEKTEAEKDQLAKAIRKKMWWGKAPHLKLLEIYKQLEPTKATGQSR